MNELQDNKEPLENSEAQKQSTQEEAEKKRRGRPKGAKNKTTLMKEKENKEGTKIKTSRGIKAPPEFKHRVSAGALKDTYAAANRAMQHKTDMWNWECQMIKLHNEEHGTSYPLPPKPAHPFDAPPAPPAFGEDECLSFLAVLSILPAQFGMESRPNEQATREAAAALAKLLRHYPMPDSRLADWSMFALAGAQWAMPWFLEARAKRRGTWAIEREKFEMMGMVPPEQRSENDGPDA